MTTTPLRTHAPAQIAPVVAVSRQVQQRQQMRAARVLLQLLGLAAVKQTLSGDSVRTPRPPHSQQLSLLSAAVTLVAVAAS